MPSSVTTVESTSKHTASAAASASMATATSTPSNDCDDRSDIESYTEWEDIVRRKADGAGTVQGLQAGAGTLRERRKAAKLRRMTGR